MFLFFGTSTIQSEIHADSANIKVVGTNTHHAVSSAGDVDGDGLDDWLIGEFNYDDLSWGNRGRVHIVLASTIATHTNISIDETDYQSPAPTSMASLYVLLDVDGEAGDIIIGTEWAAPAKMGAVYIMQAQPFKRDGDSDIGTPLHDV